LTETTAETETPSESSYDYHTIESMSFVNLPNDLDTKNYFKNLGYIPNRQYLTKLSNVFEGNIDKNLLQLHSSDMVFNSDSESRRRNILPTGPRYIVRLGQSDDGPQIPQQLQPFINFLIEIYGENSIRNWSILWSDESTTMQDSHVDYVEYLHKWPGLYVPIIGIIALEEDVKIEINKVMVSIAPRECVLFKGNTFHRGLSWNHCKGARLHFYIETPNVQSDSTVNGFEVSKDLPIEITYSNWTNKRGQNQQKLKTLCFRMKCFLFILSTTLPVKDYIIQECQDKSCPSHFKFIYICFQEYLKKNPKFIFDLRKNENLIRLVENCDHFNITKFIEFNNELIISYLINIKKKDLNILHIRLLPGNDINLILSGYTYPTIVQINVSNDNSHLNKWKLYLTFKKEMISYIYELYLLVIIKCTEEEEDCCIYLKDYTIQQSWLEKRIKQNDFRLDFQTSVFTESEIENMVSQITPKTFLYYRRIE